MVLALVSGWYFVVLYRRSFGSGVMFGIDSNRVWLPPVFPSCRVGCMRSLALVPFPSLFRVFSSFFSAVFSFVSVL